MEGFFFYQKKRSLKKYRSLVRGHREGALLFDPTTNVIVEVNAVFLHLLKYDSNREGRARLVRRDMAQAILPEAQGNGENSIELLERMEREVYRSKVACVQAAFGFLSAEGVIVELQIWLTFVWVKSSRKANRGLLGLVVARELSDRPPGELVQPVPRAPPVGPLQPSPAPEYSPLVPARPAQPALERPAVVVDPDKLLDLCGGARKPTDSADIRPSSLVAQLAAHSHTQNTHTRTPTQPQTANPSTQAEAKGAPVEDKPPPRNEHLASITLNTESLFQLGAVRDSPASMVVVALHPEEGGDNATGKVALDGGAPPVATAAALAAPMSAAPPVASIPPENTGVRTGEPRPSLTMEALPAALPVATALVPTPQTAVEERAAAVPPSAEKRHSSAAPLLAQKIAFSASDELTTSTSEDASA